MSDRRLATIVALVVVVALTAVSCILIVLNGDGAAEFELFGQRFSSTNIGLGVLFLAVVVLVITLRRSDGTDPATATANEVLAASASGEQISWDEFISGVQALVLKLTAADGFRPDLVVGICGGGLMVADLVAKRLGHIPCLAIWPDRHSHKPGSAFGGLASRINQIDLDGVLRDLAANRVLVIDDVIYSGKTLREGMEFLVERSSLIREGAVEIQCAALFALTSSAFKADFTIYQDSVRRKMMPSSDRLRR